MPVDIRRLEPSQIDAVVDLALRAWEPNFASTADILGPRLFRRNYGDDWRAYQRALYEKAGLTGFPNMHDSMLL